MRVPSGLRDAAGTGTAAVVGTEERAVMTSQTNRNVVQYQNGLPLEGLNINKLHAKSFSGDSFWQRHHGRMMHVAIDDDDDEDQTRASCGDTRPAMYTSQEFKKERYAFDQEC